MLTVLLEQDHGEQARSGKATRQHVGRRRIAWLIFSQSRQLNFSRTSQALLALAQDGDHRTDAKIERVVDQQTGRLLRSWCLASAIYGVQSPALRGSFIRSALVGASRE